MSSALAARPQAAAPAPAPPAAASQPRPRPLVACRATWRHPSLAPAADASAAAKGADRPWATAHVGAGAAGLDVRANGQPIMAPRTADMAGDPFGLLLRQRTVFLGGEVEDFGADAIISQLLLLDQQDASKDIKMFINSPGGSVTAGMGIYDAMQLCRAPVQTFCFGLAASMGAFLLGAGRAGKRHSMPNSRIMIHQPLGGASGQAVDIEIQAKEIMYHKATLNRIMSGYTGQPLSKIEEDTDRDRYMSPLEAKDYGIIDHIIGGEEAVFRVAGSTRRFPRSASGDAAAEAAERGARSVLDGGSFLPSRASRAAAPSHRFSSVASEPYMQSQAPAVPWFAVKRVSKDEYREVVQRRAREAREERDRERAAEVGAAEGGAAAAAAGGGGDAAALAEASAAEAPKKRRTPKERMDANWEE
jgi:ATP-dependent Clp protease protease subunit